MPICKFCSKPFAWGFDGERWTPLVPVGEEGTLDRTYQDENGDMRASHRDICVLRGGPSVNVVRLAKKIPAVDLPPRQWTEPDEHGEVFPESLTRTGVPEIPDDVMGRS